MKAPMPKSVVVLGKRHAVLVEKTTLNQHIMGNYKPFQSLLTIDADCHPETKKAVMIHEALHAIDVAVGTRLTEEQNTALSSGIFALM